LNGEIIMPTYTYECSECHHRFEERQSMKDEALTECPECKKHELKKIIVPAGGFRIGGLGVHKPTAHWGDPR